MKSTEPRLPTINTCFRYTPTDAYRKESRNRGGILAQVVHVSSFCCLELVSLCNAAA
jgi:hypothetical protein